MSAAFQATAFQLTAFQIGGVIPPVVVYTFDPGYGPNGELRIPVGAVAWKANSPFTPVVEGYDRYTTYGLGINFIPGIDQNDDEGWKTQSFTDVPTLEPMDITAIRLGPTALGINILPDIDQDDDEGFKNIYLGGIP